MASTNPYDADYDPTIVLDISDRTKRFESVTQLTDRILNPKVKELRIVQRDTDAPEWTDGRIIWLNETALPAFSTKADRNTLMVWMGVNYHGLGHTLHSPRKSSKLMKMIATAIDLDSRYANLRFVENLVEDQRMERLMVQRYRYITPYLVRAAVELIVKETVPTRSGAARSQAQQRQTDIGRAWPLIAGRTWLDPEVRRASLEAFKGDGKVFAELIGQYQRFPDVANDDADEAFDVLEAIGDLLTDMEQEYPGAPPKGCANGKGEVQELTAGGQPTPSPGAGDETVPSGGAPTDEAMNPPEDGDGDDGQGEGDQSGTGVPDGDDGDASSGDGGGTGGNGQPTTIRDLADALTEQAKEAIRSDTTFKDHLDTVLESVNFDKNDNKSSLATGVSTIRREASPALRGTANKLGQTFRKFVDLAMPFWEWETNVGKLNVGRFLSDDDVDMDTVFDRFEEGMVDDVSLDVTILVDVSSSMDDGIMSNGQSVYEWKREKQDRTGRWPSNDEAIEQGMRTLVDLASEATWVIRKAVERAEGTCTVLAYNDRSFLVNQTGSKPHSTQVEYMKASGQTDPSKAIIDTYHRLKGVDAANRIVVAVTDGQWVRGRDVMQKITDSGVTTVGVLITRSPYGDGGRRMGVEHYASVVNPIDMVKLFERVVASQLSAAVGLK